MQNNISLEIHSASSGLWYMYNILKLVLEISELVNYLIAKSQQLNSLYNSSPVDFSLIFSVDFNALTYIASLIYFCFTHLFIVQLIILKLLVHTLVWWLSWACFSRCEFLSVMINYMFINSSVPSSFTLCLWSNLGLSFTRSCVDSVHIKCVFSHLMGNFSLAVFSFWTIAGLLVFPKME